MNKLYRTLVYDDEVSLSVLDTTELVSKAIKIHNLDCASSQVLGGLLTACAFMAGCLKSADGAVSITVKLDDGVSCASVSGDKAGHIRGYAEGFKNGIRGGNMTVIKDDGYSRPFLGTCELKSGDISENFMQYFQKSEQIDTAAVIDVKIENGTCVAAGGIIMQLLPGTREENAELAEKTMRGFVPFANRLLHLGADGIMQKYFPSAMKNSAAYIINPEYKCNCSRKKIEGVVLSLGKAEAEGIVKEQGAVKVHCHYCNTDYAFTEEDVLKLFGN